MRSKVDIEKQIIRWKEYNPTSKHHRLSAITVELLLDIRELLSNPPVEKKAEGLSRMYINEGNWKEGYDKPLLEMP